MTFVKSLLRLLVSIFAPIILVVLGSGAVSLGLTYQYTWIIWLGMALIVSGIVWGLLLYFYAESGY